jgi:hypothetical protein
LQRRIASITRWRNASPNRLNQRPATVEFSQWTNQRIIRRQLPPGRVTLSIFSRLRLLYLCHFSKPATDCPVYRAIRRHNARKIVELGIGSAQRAMRMIEVAGRTSSPEDIHYVGMDLFEGRAGSGQAALSLKEAHQLLRATGVRVQLVPGNPAESLIRLANSLHKVDLLILPGELDSAALARMWFFVPRMLHEQSVVMVENVQPDGQKVLRIKPRAEIDRMASGTATRRAA